MIITGTHTYTDVSTQRRSGVLVLQTPTAPTPTTSKYACLSIEEKRKSTRADTHVHTPQDHHNFRGRLKTFFLLFLQPLPHPR